MTEVAEERGRSGGRLLDAVVRRKWIVVAIVLVTTLAGVGSLFIREAEHRASAKVLITNQNLPLAIAGVSEVSPPGDPIRIATTEAEVVRLREVVRRARDSVGLSGVPLEDLRDRLTVASGLDSDLLTIRVTHPNADVAVSLVNAVAEEYVAYRTELDTAKVQSAREDILAQLQELRDNGEDSGPYYSDLLSSAQQLATVATVGASNYNVVESAGAAVQVSPRPVRDTVIAALVGLIAGLVAALLVDRLDRGVRSPAEAEEILGTSLLARVDAGPDRRGARYVAALARPEGRVAESFRMLRANFEFANTVSSARVVMVTSAQPQEGKSTVAANLAATLAASGRKVVLADLDIRRPTIHAFFRIPQTPGATQVAAGTADLMDVIVPIELNPEGGSTGGGPGGAGEPGRLLVVPAGIQPPNPGQFIASRAIAQLVERLRGLGEIVIVDVPPILACGDAKSLSPSVDAMLLVAKLRSATRPVLEELRREVDATASSVLGLVLTGTAPPVGYGYYVQSDKEAERSAERAGDASVPLSG